MPNNTRNFNPINPGTHWVLRKLKIVPSVAMAQGTALASNLVGALQVLDGSPDTNFRGILAEAITASDADYATTGKRKGVWVPTSPENLMTFTVGAGTFTVDDEEKNVKVHTDGVSVAVDTAGLHLRIVKYLNATQGIGSILISPSAS